MWILPILVLSFVLAGAQGASIHDESLEAEVMIKEGSEKITVKTSFRVVKETFDVYVGANKMNQSTMNLITVTSKIVVSTGERDALVVMHVLPTLRQVVVGNVHFFELGVEWFITVIDGKDVEMFDVKELLITTNEQHEVKSKKVHSKKKMDSKMAKRHGMFGYHHKRSLGKCLKHFFRHLNRTSIILMSIGALGLLVVFILVIAICRSQRRRVAGPVVGESVDAPAVEVNAVEKKAPMSDTPTTFHLHIGNDVDVSDKINLIA